MLMNEFHLLHLEIIWNYILYYNIFILHVNNAQFFYLFYKSCKTSFQGVKPAICTTNIFFQLSVVWDFKSTKTPTAKYTSSYLEYT